MHNPVRKMFSSLAVCIFSFSLAFFSFPSAAESNGRFVPLNPAFLKYRDAVVRSGAAPSNSVPEAFRPGVFPGPIDFSYLKGAKAGDALFERLSSRKYSRCAVVIPPYIPRKFDLAAEGRVTPVLSQGSWGTCWAFATMESVESSLLSLTDKRYDLSEMSLAWFMYSDESPEKMAYTSSIPPDSQKENPVFDNGGQMLLEQPAALFSRGTGPLYETDAPYPDIPQEDKQAWVSYVPDPLPYGPARFHLKEALRFTDSTNIKKALMEIGGLSISFSVYWAYIDTKTGNIYTPPDAEDEPDGGHAVMLVGWDDDYPKENFVNAKNKQPSANGAWKIQNSWGTQRGEKGYFWISYEDSGVMPDGALAFIMEPLDSYDGIYFHDPLGMCYMWETTWAEAGTANAFVATRDEKIVEVSFMTANTDLEYEIQIYKDIAENASPLSGYPVFSVPQKGTAEATGYYSVKLDKSVSIRKGERFAVGITLRLTATSTPSDTVRLPVETVISQYSDKVKVYPGESYLRSEKGEWIDTCDYDPEESDDDDPDPLFNFCIKAFTVKNSDTSGGCEAGSWEITGLIFATWVLSKKRKPL